MRFLADQDVYGQTISFLARLGHDVIRAAQIGLAQAHDSDLLRVAREQDRIFVTRDRDFGALVFLHGISAGVFYLRMTPSTQDFVHNELARVLTLYDEADLKMNLSGTESAD